MITSHFIHTATVTAPGTSTVNGDGEATDVAGSSVTTKCRFHQPSTMTGGFRMFDSGDHAVLNPQVLLPGTVTISEDYTVTTTTPGFARSFKVMKVYTVYNDLTKSISHKKADLEVILNL